MAHTFALLPGAFIPGLEKATRLLEVCQFWAMLVMKKNKCHIPLLSSWPEVRWFFCNMIFVVSSGGWMCCGIQKNQPHIMSWLPGKNESVVVIHEEKNVRLQHRLQHHIIIHIIHRCWCQKKDSGNMAKTVGHTGTYLVLVNKANINNMEQPCHDVCKMKYLSKLSSSNSYSKFIQM